MSLNQKSLEPSPNAKAQLRKPKQILFEQMTEGMRLLLCEIKEGVNPYVIDLVKIIGIDTDKHTIKVTNRLRKETAFVATDKGWLVLHEDPFNSEKCTSIRGPFYTFFTA
jgi:hypothetical protein